MPAPVPLRSRFRRSLLARMSVALAAFAAALAIAGEPIGAATSASVAAVGPVAPAAPAMIPALERGLPVMRNFLPRDYRGHNQIWKILETRDGVMLFSNLHQLVEFDGLNWSLIPVPGASYIRAMTADAAGTVWLAGINELGRLVRGPDGRLVYESFRARVPADLGDLGAIWCIHALRDGIYFQGNHAVLRWDGAKFDVWRINQKSTVLSFPFGDTLIVAREDGWFIPRPGGLWEQVGAAELGTWLPRFFIERSAGEWLVGHGTKGLFDFKAGTATKRTVDIEPWFTSKKTYSGQRLPDGRYLFTSLQGGAVLLSADLKFETLFDESSGLVTQTVISACLDRHGALWLGTDRGICRVELNSPVTVFGPPHQLGRNGPETIHRVNDRIVVSGDRSMLELAPAPALPGHAQFKPSFKDGDRFTHFLRRTDGVLASGLTGLFWIAGGEPKPLGGPSGIREVIELQAQPGRYVATHLTGVASWRHTGDQWSFEGDWPEVRGELRGLIEDRDGALWVTTLNDGVRRIEPSRTAARAEKVARFADADGLPVNRTRVWLGRVGGAPLFFTEKGAFRFDSATQRFSPETGFGARFNEGSTIVRIYEEDDQGGLWVANESRGQFPTQILYARRGESTQLPLTDVTDLGSINFLKFEKRAGQEILWIGGQADIRQVDLVRWRQQPPPPLGPTLLRTIQAGNELRIAPDTANVRLRASENTLRFTFGTPGLGGESEPMHETRLRGFASGEVRLARAAERTFTNLPAGRYTFEVRGRSADGRWSEPAVFAFAVQPPWLAWSGYTALAGLALFAYVRWRIRRLTRERTRLEGIVADRTAELAAKNRELERLNRVEQDEKLAALLSEEKARLELLRYQLNPHFLFNSLNSIRALVFAHPEAAGEMVTKLAEFCRWTLTRGSDETATVADEIEMVRTYLDVEKVRWQEALVTSIEVDDTARTERLPQFLLLPLIENAIKYGSKTSPATLEVRVTIRTDGDYLACEVANTGRWVMPAAESSPTSTLIGLDNLRQRLARHYGPGCEIAIARDPGWVRMRLRLKRGLPTAPKPRSSHEPFPSK